MTASMFVGEGIDDVVKRLTGRWAISVRGFLITLVLGVLGFATDLTTMPAGDVVVLLGTMVAIFSVIAVLNFALHRTRWRHRREQPVPIAEFVSVLVGTGLLIALSFSIAEAFFGLRTSIGVTEGFVVYPVLTVWIGSTVVLYLDVVDRARTIRERALDQHAASVMVVSRAEALAAEIHHSVDEQVGIAIEQVRQSASTGESALPAAIREVIDGPVRATSRRLWEAAERGSTRIGIGEVLWAVIREPRLRPLAIIGLAVVLPLVRDVDGVTWPAILAAVVISLVIALECWIANAAFRRHRRWRHAVLGVVVLVFSTQSVLIQAESYRWGRTPVEVGFVTVVIFTFIFVVITSMLGSYRDLDRRRAEQIAQVIRVDRLQAMTEARVACEEARRLAGLLHGRVQSRLLGCAMALEFAGDDPVALRRALDRLGEVLAEDWTGADEAGPGRHFEEIVAHWSGVAEVTIDGDGVESGSASPAVFTVVEELVANSVRHGRARRVHVAIVSRGDTYSVVVSDDGQAATVSPPGLGTRIIDRLGSRLRSSAGPGWTVEVEVPA